MLNAHQLRQLAEQTSAAATVAEARVGIFDEKDEPSLMALALTNAAAARQLHEGIAALLAEKQGAGE
jgi:hypothetical protein